jgi:hypothetical protein
VAAAESRSFAGKQEINTFDRLQTDLESREAGTKTF